MKNIKSIVILLLLIGYNLSAQSTIIPVSVISQGATKASAGTMVLAGTVGQTVIGFSQNPTLYNYQGFWNSISRYIIFISDVKEEVFNSSSSKLLGLKNYPNPIVDNSTFEFNVSAANFVSLKLFNSLGKEVKSLVDGFREPGLIKVSISANELGSGQYLAVLNVGSKTDRINVIVLK